MFDKTIRDEDIFAKDFLITAKVADTSFRMKINDAKHANIYGKETVLDKQIIDNLLNKLVDCFKKNNSKYIPFPKNVDILVNANENNGSSQDTNAKNQEEILDIRTPRFSMNDIYVPEDIKEEIGTALTILEHKSKLFEDWKLGDGYTGKQALVMNFYGPPGTGKSMICEGIASYLGKKIFIVNYAQLESKYVGETPKNIKKVFELASKEGAVLVFDEADSFLSKRLTSITQAADYGVNITRSVMLIELEKFLNDLDYLKKNQKQATTLLHSKEFHELDEKDLSLLKIVHREKIQFEQRQTLIEQIKLKEKNQQPLLTNEIEILG